MAQLQIIEFHDVEEDQLVIYRPEGLLVNNLPIGNSIRTKNGDVAENQLLLTNGN